MALNRWLRGYRGPSKDGSGGGGGGGTPDPHAPTHLNNDSDPIDAATTSIGGLMSAADKTKLNTMATVDVDAAVAVATTAQGTATALTKQVNVVTTGNQFDGCRLPSGWPVGVPVYVFNRLGSRSAGVLNFVRVFPNSGENMTAQAANLPHFLVTEAVGIYTKVSSTVWHVAVLNMPVGQSGLSYTDDTYWYRAAQFLGGITLSSTLTVASGGQITFGGSTTNNKIVIPDNQAEALWIGEGTNRYLGFVSTDNAEALLFYKKISGYLATINTQTNDYTLVLTAGTGDTGKVVEIDVATGKTLTLPATAAVGTCATVVQVGVGQITFASTGSGTVVNANSHTKSRTQWSVCSVYCRANAGGSAAQWVLSGDTAA